MSKQLSIIRVALACGCLLLLRSPAFAISTVPLDKPEHYPRWWFEQDMIPLSTTYNGLSEPVWPNDYPTPDDFAAINIGQLKYAAQKAQLYLNSKSSIQGGAGTEIDNLIANWENTQNKDDYAAVNLGQLKYVATTFHDRLIDYGLSDEYPWTVENQADDYALVNLGQLKRIFQFPYVNIASEEIHWTQWSSFSPGGLAGGNGGSATGQITIPSSQIPLSISYAGSLLNESHQDWNIPDAYAWPSTNNQCLTLEGAGTHIITFASPVNQVVMNWSSLGQPSIPIEVLFHKITPPTQSAIRSPAKFRIVSLGNGSWGEGIFRRLGPDKNILLGAEGAGTILFNFDTPIQKLEMTTDTPEYRFYLQIGVID